MSLEIEDNQGNVMVVRHSSNLLKYQMEEGFGRADGAREKSLTVLKRLAESAGLPLIDMDEVRENLEEAARERDLTETSEILLEAEDKVTGETFAFEVEVQTEKIEGDVDEADLPDPVFFGLGLDDG